jgi:hypothetical protein
MPIALLRRIAAMQLPAVIEDPGEVECVRILVLAGHVSAKFHAMGRGSMSLAIVVAITPLGRRMMRMSFRK